MSSPEERQGFRELISPLTEAMLTPLPPHVKRVQVGHALRDTEYRRVSALLERRPDVTLRVYDRQIESRFADLEFLQFFPKLRRFAVELFELRNADGLRHLPDDLHHLSLGQFRKAFPLNGLSRFRGLKGLHVSAPAKPVEALSLLREVGVLGLVSWRLATLTPLLPLRKLASLSITLGSLGDCSQLPQIGKLKRLSIRRVRGINDLEWLAGMATLEELWLEDLPHVRRLPDLSGLQKLKVVKLEGLKLLDDISGLLRARSLRRLDLLRMPALAPESLAPLRHHPGSPDVRIGLGTENRNRRAIAALAPLD